MDSNKEIEAEAARGDDDKDLEGTQPKEEEVATIKKKKKEKKDEEVAFLDKEQVERLVKGIDDQLQESVLPRQIQRKEDDPTILIPRVPDRLRIGEEGEYKPSIVSIGPYHEGWSRLRPMQKQKWRFLRKILRRNPKKQLNDYVLEITQLAERAGRCYDLDLESMCLTRDKFVQILLLDGCFLVELFLPVMDDTQEEDDFFSVEGNSSLVLSDLLILENQIPFFILQRIYELATPNPRTHGPRSFTRIVIEFCNSISYHRPKHMWPPRANKIRHFLHLYHMHTLWPRESDSKFYSLSGPFSELKSIVWWLPDSLMFNIVCLKKKFSNTPRLRNRVLRNRVRAMPSATELSESGVKLKVNPWAKSILDIRFNSRGVLEIPHLFIHDLTLTYSHFRNLITFEQLFPNSGFHFTAYVKFLNSIVKKPEDVALLYRNDIIKHPSIKEEKVVHLFSSLATETTEPQKNDRQDLCEEVERCYMKRRQKWRATRHKWWAMLVHDYFSSPWSVMSLAAAVILLLLTFLQTYYSMYPYFHPSP